VQQLDRFYELIKSGTSVDKFLYEYANLFPAIRSSGLLCDYRLGRGRLKRLRDEVTPAARFVRQHAEINDRIQLSLNSSTPDCNVWHSIPPRHRTIEITVAQALERFNLMTELNHTGLGRGFLGLTDDAGKGVFLNAMGQERQMYSTENAYETMAHAVTLTAQNKSFSQATTLLIESPLEWLPENRWVEARSRLTHLVANLNFSEVYLVGSHDNGDLCLRLK
jgi:hypothetical protein